MNVKLISITESFIDEKDTAGRLTAEELLVYIARVSNPANQMNKETSDKLINHLIVNKHWSPFEMIDMTVEIVTSRAIAQQILRHRSFSFQEFSMRYAEVTEIEPVQLRLQAKKNRQSSTDVCNPIIDYYGKDIIANDAIEAIINHSEDVYKSLLKAGVAKECARMILPLTTQTKIYMKGSIRSWIHYLQIRCDEHTQLEHQQIALAIKEIFAKNFPNINKIFKNNG